MKPVAWMIQKGITKILFSEEPPNNLMQDLIPLYTHPVSQYKAITNTKIEPTVVSYTHPVKELTDKEILGCWVEEFTGNALPSIDFARAILRKAQEK